MSTVPIGHAKWSRAMLAVASVAAAVTVLVMIATSAGSAAVPFAEASVNLGTASSFAVLGGQTVTNTGPSVITGDLGVSPGSAVVGFPPGVVIGATHAADAVALQAQSDLTTAYNDAAGRTPATAVPSDLGGLTLTTGVYSNATSIGLTGTVTLDGQGDPNAVFIFQAGSTLITASNSTVALINGAQACNVYWQVGSSATLGTNSSFVGNVMALTSIAAQTGTTVSGRVLARNGAVTLDSNVITAPICTPTSPSASPSGSPSGSPSASTSASPSGSPSVSPSGSPSSSPTVPPTGSPTPSPTGGPTVTPTPSPSGGSLPVTGPNDWPLIAGGVACIAFGTTLLVWTRRRSIRSRAA